MSETDMVQADAGASALSEKVNVRSEWLPIESAPKDGTHIIGRTQWGAREVWWQSDYFEGEFWQDESDSEPAPTHWVPLPSPPGAELNFSNDAERTGVSLKSDTSLKGSEA